MRALRIGDTARDRGWKEQLFLLAMPAPAKAIERAESGTLSAGAKKGLADSASAVVISMRGAPAPAYIAPPRPAIRRARTEWWCA